MKKNMLLILSASVMLGVSGCSNNEPMNNLTEDTAVNETFEIKDDTSRFVEYNELGLSYTTPDVWRLYETTNLYPTTYTIDGVFAIIDYSYIKEKDYADYMNGISQSINQYLFSICKIVILKGENVNNENVVSLFNSYDNIKKVGKEGAYEYYLLSKYNGDISYLTGDDLHGYNLMSEAIPEFEATMKTFPFDDTILDKKNTEENKYISFITKTLEGEDINSSIFSEYDLTLFNVWGTNAYPEYNEFETLQGLYEWIETEGLNVNIVMVVTDTPSEENEAIALKVKNDANAKFKTIMPDRNFINWIVNNVTAIPSTYIVDRDGRTVGEAIKGVKDIEYYKNTINSNLNNLYE